MFCLQELAYQLNATAFLTIFDGEPEAACQLDRSVVVVEDLSCHDLEPLLPARDNR